MPQKALPSTTLAAAVRTYLGLSQELLGALLGVSRGQIAHVEAGRRPLRGEAAGRLRALALLLPPPQGLAPPLPPLSPPALSVAATAALRRRRARCRWQAANLERQLEQWQRHQQLAPHRAALLPALLAILTTAASSPTAALVHQRLTEWAAPPPANAADSGAQGLLLALRIRYLLAEADILTEWLATIGPAAGTRSTALPGSGPEPPGR